MSFVLSFNSAFKSPNSSPVQAASSSAGKGERDFHFLPALTPFAALFWRRFLIVEVAKGLAVTSMDRVPPSPQ